MNSGEDEATPAPQVTQERQWSGPWYPPYGTPMPPMFAPPMPPMPSREPATLERWRVPLIVALVAVVVIFGVLDVARVFFHAAQVGGTTRPLIINAQLIGDATPAAHPDLGLSPATLPLTCGKTGRILVTNTSARPLSWSVTAGGDGFTFSADTPRSGLLAPGRDVALVVMAFSQPGTYTIHFVDDHGETGDVTVQIAC